MSYNKSSDGDFGVLWGFLAFVGVVVGIWLIAFLVGWAGSFESPQAGEVGVIREGPSLLWFGDWGNSHNIKGVLAPGQGTTNTGLGSSVHYYPSDASQRYYTITADAKRGDRPGVDVVKVQSSDGIEVGLEGTFYFTSGFNGSSAGKALVKEFDNRFGVRTFPVVGSPGNELHAYDGSDGWAAFLDAVIRPIIDNDLRTTVGQFSCAELIPACALVYNQSVSAVQAHTGAANTSLAAIQTAIQNRLQSDIASTLGQDYFTGSNNGSNNSGIKFLITGRPTLPTQVQDEINNAQAQFARVGTTRAQVDQQIATARGKLQQATLLAQANEAKQRGYAACPACAQIDELGALPNNLSTLVLGANSPIAVK